MDNTPTTEKEQFGQYLILTIVIVFILGAVGLCIYGITHPDSTLDRTTIQIREIESAEYNINPVANPVDGTIVVEAWSTLPRYIRMYIEPDYEKGATPATQSVIDNLNYNTDDWIYHPQKGINKAGWYFKGTISGQTPQTIILASQISFPNTDTKANKEMPVKATAQTAPSINPDTGIYMTEEEAWDWFDTNQLMN